MKDKEFEGKILSYNNKLNKKIQALENYKKDVNYNEKDIEQIKAEKEKQKDVVKNLNEMAVLAGSMADISFSEKMLEESDKLRELETRLDKREKIEEEVKKKQEEITEFVNQIIEEKKQIKERITKLTEEKSKMADSIKIIKEGISALTDAIEATEDEDERKQKQEEVKKKNEELIKLRSSRVEKDTDRKELIEKLGELNKIIKKGENYLTNGILDKENEEETEIAQTPETKPKKIKSVRIKPKEIMAEELTTESEETKPKKIKSVRIKSKEITTEELTTESEETKPKRIRNVTTRQRETTPEEITPEATDFIDFSSFGDDTERTEENGFFTLSDVEEKEIKIKEIYKDSKTGIRIKGSSEDTILDKVVLTSEELATKLRDEEISERVNARIKNCIARVAPEETIDELKESGVDLDIVYSLAYLGKTEELKEYVSAIIDIEYKGTLPFNIQYDMRGIYNSGLSMKEIREFNNIATIAKECIKPPATVKKDNIFKRFVGNIKLRFSEWKENIKLKPGSSDSQLALTEGTAEEQPKGRTSFVPKQEINHARANANLEERNAGIQTIKDSETREDK